MKQPTKKPAAPKKRGRRPAGISRTGQPEKTSEYPKLTIAMQPDTKSRLDAVAQLENRPAWRIVETALSEYFAALPGADRSAVEAMAAARARKSA